MGSLLPYIGESRGKNVKNVVRAVCDNDKTGTVSYHFNSLGFRSEEFDANASRRIFVCGDSHVFGVGLSLGDLWTSHFKKEYSKIHGIDPGQVNLLNFAMGGESNDYIARTIISQCSRIKPNLAIAVFTYSERIEILSGDTAKQIGHWVTSDRAKNYFALIDPLNAYAASLKNVLLFQWFAKCHEIDYVISWFSYDDYCKKKFSGNKIVAGLEQELDRTHVTDRDLFTLHMDLAVDKKHYGPKTHLAFAEHLAEHYRRSHFPDT